MPKVSITISQITPAVPQELEGVLDASYWNEVYKAVGEAQTSGNCYACACEIWVCVCFFFPCIFCIHPCLASSLSKGKRKDFLRKINKKTFQGRPVFGTTDNILVVNTDLINPPGFRPAAAVQSMAPPVTATVQSVTPPVVVAVQSVTPPVVVAVQTVTPPVTGTVENVSAPEAAVTEEEPSKEDAVQNPMATSGNVMAVDPPVAPVEETSVEQREMKLTVPEGAVPGSMLTVSAPDGSTVKVAIPEDVTSGQVMTVKY